MTSCLVPPHVAYCQIYKNRAAQDSKYMNIVEHTIYSKWSPIKGAKLSHLAVVKFRILKNGTISEIRLTQSTGDAASDAQAIKALKLASPLPPPPQESPVVFTFNQGLSKMAQIAEEKSNLLADNEAADKAALDLLQKQTEVFGDNDVRLAGSLNEVGTLDLETGKYSQAKEHFEKALKLQEQSLEKNSLLESVTLLNLANLAVKNTDLNTAEDLFAKAISIRKSQLPPGNYLILDAQELYAKCLFKNNKIDQANVIYAELRANEKLRRNSLDEVRFRQNAAVSKMLNGNLSAAISELEILTQEDPTYQVAWRNLGIAYNNLGLQNAAKNNYSNAEENFKRSVYVYDQTFDGDYALLSASLHNLANTLVIEQKFAAAKPILERACALLQKTKDLKTKKELDEKYSEVLKNLPSTTANITSE